MLKDIASKNKPAIYMSTKNNATINTLQLMRAKFAQKIAETSSPETDAGVNQVYLPLYEISAVMILAAQEAKKTDYHDSLENRAALTLVKKQLATLQISAQRIHYVIGYRFANKTKEAQEMQHEISILKDIANDLLA